MERTSSFALQVIYLWQKLPHRTDAAVLGKQLLRSATSVGANYRSACHAKSRADFFSKIKICEEEADESEYWLELMVKGGIVQEHTVAALYRESHELASIFASIAKSLHANTKNG